MFNYLYTDKREAESGLWQRVSLIEAPRCHCEKVTMMMRTLTRGHWLIEQVEPGLHYLLIDSACPTEKYDAMFQKLLLSGPHFSMLSVNDLKKHQLGYYPFPLCIQDSESLFRFYNGEFVMFVFVDIDYVNLTLAPKGLQVTVKPNDEYPWQVVSSVGEDPTLERGDCYIGFHPVGRLGAEFLCLDWLLQNIVAGPRLDASDKSKP